MKKGKGKNSKLLPNSFRIISSCIKTVSTNASTAVRSAGATVAASISSGDDHKEQVLWAGFDKLELSPTAFRRVLLLGYVKGFQVFDVEEASSLSELVSRRDGPITFLQMLPCPANFDGMEKNKSHPILAVVGGNENKRITSLQNTGQGHARYGLADLSLGVPIDPPTTVRFYSMKLNEYVKVIDFKSAVLMVRCSPRIVAIGLEEQVYCLDALSLEKKFIVVTYPVAQVGEQGAWGINTGYGPMAVGPRWLAYPPNRPFMLNTGRVSPQSLASSVSPLTSPGTGTMMGRYAVEPGKQLATGLLTGCKRLSRYCPELLPESPSSPGWGAGKLAASEPENAGVVAVKDLVCSEVISQFRAHTSPISALCFDPSGTLLVTASIHGNNINVFRIMPSHKCGGSSSGDWDTSYAHLYKLHRGITSAVIQDICFSHCSRWIAIVSSRGTCHIFVLSPFRGDNCFQTLHTDGQGTSLFLASTGPWWSTSSFSVHEQHSLPPPPCTLSVITRIKFGDSGLLNSVSNAAASMAGKLWVPSGAVTAIFHNSNSTGSLDAKSTGSSLEHILVYTPSGFVVQHEILYIMGLGEGGTESVSARQVKPSQNEELRVKVDPIQWWDVCRRLDAVEREECIPGTVFDGPHTPEICDESRMVVQGNLSLAGKKLITTNSQKFSERSQWYLSNAEVQINSGRSPIWQNLKMRFHVVELPIAKCCLSGEFEIEMAPTHEIEIRQKDLLPIFDNFPRARSAWIDRCTSSISCQVKEKSNEASIICLSKPPSCSSTESSDGGSSRRMENFLDLDHMNLDRCPILVSHPSSDLFLERDENSHVKVSLMDQGCKPIPVAPTANVLSVNLVVDNAVISRSSSMGNETPSSNVNDTDSDADVLRPSWSEETVDFLELFKEEYCNKPEFHGGNTQEEDKNEEGWIGGMFDFSEEG